MNTAAIRMALQWRVIPEETAAMMSALQTVLVRTRLERGCISCALSTEIGSRLEIRYVADWESEDDLQRHIRSSDFSKLAELMERGIEPPTIEFALPSGTRGMDYAEKIRGIRRQAYRH
jgi:quinol monooxygenase YgiN